MSGWRMTILPILGTLVAGMLLSGTTLQAAQASGCVMPTKDHLHGKMGKTSAWLSTYNGKRLCTATKTFYLAAWVYIHPADGKYPQAFKVKAAARIPAGGTTATATLPYRVCGQMDAYWGSAPSKGDTLTSPTGPFQQVFLGKYANMNRSTVSDTPSDCATKVVGNVTFNGGSVDCVSGQPVFNKPTVDVEGDLDVQYDWPRGVTTVDWSSDSVINATGVAHPDTEILTGVTHWEFPAGPKPAAPASCYVHPKKRATGHITCGCASGKHIVKYVLNNTRSVDGTRGHLATATYHLRKGNTRWSVSVLAGKKVVIKRSVRRGTRVSLSVYGHVIDHARVTGSCTAPPTSPSPTGERTLTGGKVVLGKA